LEKKLFTFITRNWKSTGISTGGTTMNGTMATHLTIPLGVEAHATARKFAAQQATPKKGKRVYLNTLAVYAVHAYFKYLQLETDITQGDSWKPGIRALFDVADLVIPGIGKLECRPILPNEKAFRLPSEAIERRVGYVGVQFQQELDEVQLLGFVPSVDPGNPPEEIEIQKLQPLEALLYHLERLEVGRETVQPILQREAEVDRRVQQILESRLMEEIVADLERIFRTCEEYEWSIAAEEALSGGAMAGGAVRELDDEEEAESELQDLAENLMNKLAERWRNSA
jgi:hypothetical protein